MPKPGELHHCKKCGSKGGAQRSRQRGLCKHKKSCCGTLDSPHHEFFMGTDEDCVICETVQDLADRRELEQRERDKEEAERVRQNGWYTETAGRKKPRTED